MKLCVLSKREQRNLLDGYQQWEKKYFPPLQVREVKMEAAFPPKRYNFSTKLNGMTAQNNLGFIFASLNFLTLKNSECLRSVNSPVSPVNTQHLLLRALPAELFLLSSAYHYENIKQKALKFSPISSWFCPPYQRMKIAVCRYCYEMCCLRHSSTYVCKVFKE